jgi:hypothetical protein
VNVSVTITLLVASVNIGITLTIFDLRDAEQR